MNLLRITVSLFGAVFLILFWCDGCGSLQISSGGDLNLVVNKIRGQLLLRHLGFKPGRYARDTFNAEVNVSESYQRLNGTVVSNRTENVTKTESVSVLNSTLVPTSEPESTPEPTRKSEPEPTYEPSSTSEPVVEPKTTAEILSEPHSTPEPAPETTSEPIPEPEASLKTKSEPEPSPKINSTAESVSEPTSEPNPSAEPETTSEPKPSHEPVSTAEPSVEPKPTHEPKSTAEPVSEPESTAEPVPEQTSEPTSEPRSTAEPTSEPVVTPEPNPESNTSPEPTSEPESTAEPTSEPVVTPEPNPEPNSSPEPTSEPKSTAEPELTPEPNPTSEPEITPEPEVTSEPHPEPNATAEPTGEPVSEPTGEPELVSEPTPEAESSSPEPEVEPEPEAEGAAFAEPHPVWDVAMKEWQWGWEILVYFFAASFLLIALLSLLSVIRLWKIKHLLSKNYFMVLNILIIFKCVLRALYLLIDAYNVRGTYHPVLAYFLYSTAFPCLTSAFSILFYALLLATKMKMLSSKIQKSSVLIGIIAFHFILSISTDFVVGFFTDAKIMLLICQSFYILWGIILFLGYIFIFRRLRESAIKRRKTLKKHSISYPSDISRKSVVSSMGSLPRPKKSRNKSTLNSAITVTLVAAACGLFCIILEFFGIFYVFRMFTDGYVPEPWPWYVHQFLLRVFELIMCAIMVYVGSQPIKYNRRNDSKPCYLFCFVLKKCCCSSQENSENDQNTSFGSSHFKSFSDSEYDSSDAKSSKKQSKNVMVEQNGNGPQPCKHTHIVIEEGLVRFRSEDELTDGVSDRASSLPDLLHGNAVSTTNTGMCNMAFSSNGNVPATNTPLHRTNTEPSEMMEKNLGSVGTIGTIGANIPSINLAHSLQWEFDKAYDRSFQLADDNDDKPPTYGEVEMQEQDVDPPTDKSESSETDDSCGPVSPTRRPLITGEDSSADVSL
ncbi:proline-rich transmembrane protein 4-like [Saccostrea cucullata]|uniref:proline-rich transmembrane protein 4-like n=1 Tax=Saccostrea cuccullata TaxID=36930 RepID=UPI002ED4CADE